MLCYSNAAAPVSVSRSESCSCNEDYRDSADIVEPQVYCWWVHCITLRLSYYVTDANEFYYSLRFYFSNNDNNIIIIIITIIILKNL